MTAASVNGITIEYDVHGDDGGEPLLLVMGLGGQLVAWPLEFVDLLVARGFRVIRFDNRDIGLSTMMPAPPPTRRQLMLATLSRRFAKSSYLDRRHGRRRRRRCSTTSASSRAHVVGISMGGMISQALAIRHPGKVASLTSIMSNTGDRKHGKIKRSLLRKLPRLMVRTPDNAVDNGVEMFRLISGPALRRRRGPADGRGGVRPQLPPRGRRPARRWPSPPAPTARGTCVGCGCPTLVVHGLVDPLVTPSGGIATAQAIPGAKLVMYPDMGHDLPAAAVGRHHRRDRRQRPARRSGRVGGRPRRGGLTAWTTAPDARHARRRGRARAGDLDRRGRAHRHRRAAPHHPRRARLRRADARPARPARPPRADDERDHRDHRRAGAAARAPSSSSTGCGRRRRSCCCPTRSPSSPAR